MTRAAATADPDDVRRRRLLDAALATFLRYGFRKTSMEEVARTAGLSRQGLYLHFATKEELFGEVVHHGLATGLDEAFARLREPTGALEHKLVAAFDAWVGRFVGVLGDVSDLQEAITQYGPVIAEHDERFVDGVAKVLRGSRLAATAKAAGVSARQLADTLNATARGLKHACATRSQFRDRIEIAVRALCAPAR